MPSNLPSGSMIEPFSNINQSQVATDVNEGPDEWVQEHMITVPQEDSALVDFYFINSRMILISEAFDVQEIDLTSKKVVKFYNLQEIEGFEINEDLEEDKLRTFTLDKDVMLVAVALQTSVILFEYCEEEELSLTFLTKIDAELESVTSMEFVGYSLIILQDIDDQNVKVHCYDLEQEAIRGSLDLAKQGGSVQIKAANEAFMFTAGTQLGKVDI